MPSLARTGCYTLRRQRGLLIRMVVIGYDLKKNVTDCSNNMYQIPC